MLGLTMQVIFPRSTTLVFLDTVHHQVEHDVSETGFCRRLQVNLFSWAH
jgi:hypothetical protein